ncbi:glutathione S-transferase family protein [Nitrosomonas sp. Is35]|uniref:glutathione S-transferase family protein n=1 Tax=unclassified Nitrosomonas TaxID=2609265 RepID=UPI00294B5833|nr:MULTISPECIES: glutathione S-transferase family protein [unclassified Nitrosomonas]MDV6341589.1 glutathione S-transferase family protein [Nitrosomonas sp. Is24]MDV6347173.1 glutathione S-transferase family protein [Nitrosomonas sp. Is35]
MLKLHQFERTWGIPNLSPFCCKIETYLRMAGIAYEIKPALPLRAPKGKLPYISDNGKTLGDSRFIIEYLKSTYYDLDSGLAPEELAISTALQRLLEEHLFWVALYSRWQFTDENWQVNKQAIFGALPPIVRDIAASHTRKKIQQQIHGHGTGRHQTEEIFALGKQDIDALAAYLGHKPYFFGGRPTTLDASAFGLLINISGCPIESPLKEHALTKENLVAYIERISHSFYPDLQHP